MLSEKLEKARAWLRRVAGMQHLAYPHDKTDTALDAEVLLAFTQPVPPGELAEAVDFLERGNLLNYRDTQGREWPYCAIRTVLHALRQQQVALADYQQATAQLLDAAHQQETPHADRATVEAVRACGYKELPAMIARRRRAIERMTREVAAMQEIQAEREASS